MAFDSFGGGLARGLQTGAKLSADIKARDEQAEAREMQARQKQFMDSLNNSQEASEEAFARYSEALVEMAPLVEDSDPNFTKLLEGAQLSLMGHAQVLQDLRTQAAQFGVPPEIIAQMPDPASYVRQRLPVLEAQIATARAQAAEEPISENSFDAEVEGMGNVRVVERDTPEGTKFFVDGQEIQGSQISRPVQRTEEVQALQIPGLTPSQSGQEIRAIRQQVAANNAYAQLSNRLARDVENQPEKVGTVADIIRAFGSLTAQADALASVFGLEKPFEGDIEDYNFRSLAGEAQEVKRTLLDLVFLDLAAKGQTGRAVSDRDLAIFMDRTGIESGDPEQVISGLRRGVENNRTQLTENIKARTGFDLEEIVPDGLVDFEDPGEQIALDRDVDRAIDEALAADDLERAEAIVDAVLANDRDALRKLIGQD